MALFVAGCSCGATHTGDAGPPPADADERDAALIADGGPPAPLDTVRYFLAADDSSEPPVYRVLRVDAETGALVDEHPPLPSLPEGYSEANIHLDGAAEWRRAQVSVWAPGGTYVRRARGGAWVDVCAEGLGSGCRASPVNVSLSHWTESSSTSDERSYRTYEGRELGRASELRRPTAEPSGAWMIFLEGDLRAGEWRVHRAGQSAATSWTSSLLPGHPSGPYFVASGEGELTRVDTRDETISSLACESARPTVQRTLDGRAWSRCDGEVHILDDGELEPSGVRIEADEELGLVTFAPGRGALLDFAPNDRDSVRLSLRAPDSTPLASYARRKDEHPPDDPRARFYVTAWLSGAAWWGDAVWVLARVPWIIDVHDPVAYRVESVLLRLGADGSVREVPLAVDEGRFVEASVSLAWLPRTHPRAYWVQDGRLWGLSLDDPAATPAPVDSSYRFVRTR